MATTVGTGLEGLQQAFSTLGSSLGGIVHADALKRGRMQEFFLQNPDKAKEVGVTANFTDPEELATALGLDLDTVKALRSAHRPTADQIVARRQGQDEEFVKKLTTAEDRDLDVRLAEGTNAIGLAEFQGVIRDVATRLRLPEREGLAQGAGFDAAIPLSALAGLEAKERTAAILELDEVMSNLPRDEQLLLQISQAYPQMANQLIAARGLKLQEKIAKWRLEASQNGAANPLEVLSEIRQQQKMISEQIGIVTEAKGTSAFMAEAGRLSMMQSMLQATSDFLPQHIRSSFARDFDVQSETFLRDSFDLIPVYDRSKLSGDERKLQDFEDLIQGGLSVGARDIGGVMQELLSRPNVMEFWTTLTQDEQLFARDAIESNLLLRQDPSSALDKIAAIGAMRGDVGATTFGFMAELFTGGILEGTFDLIDPAQARFNAAQQFGRDLTTKGMFSSEGLDAMRSGSLPGITLDAFTKVFDSREEGSDGQR